MTPDEQKELAFRAAFADGNTEISIYGAISTSVMQWGMEQGYAERVGDSTLYRLTDLGKRMFHMDDEE